MRYRHSIRLRMRLIFGWSVLALAIALRLGFSSNARKPVLASESKSVGADAGPNSGTVTFGRDIAPIVYEKCAPCHHAGQAAPFSLVNYAQIKKRARQIVEVTQSGYMPPWLPARGYGEFLNERRLTEQEK